MKTLLKVVPRNRRSAESGQAIVLIALVMVALLASLGMAIDGGGLFFLRRNAQNATDAAVLEATYTICSDRDATNAEIEAAGRHGAATNGFVDETLTGGATRVEVHNPPIAGTGVGDDSYVSVSVRAVKPSYFIHLVFGGPLEVTTFAVGHCVPGRVVGTYGAIWSGSLDCENAAEWSGAQSTIYGDIFSNGDIKSSGGGQGNNIYGSGDAGGTYEVSGGGNTTWNPSNPDVGVDTMEDPLNLDIDDYAPGGIVAEEAASEGLYTYIASGTYSPPNGTDLEGLIFVEEDVQISHNFDTVDTNGNGVWDGLTIVAREDISLSAGAINGVDLEYYIDGLLFFSDKTTNCGTNAVSFSASSATWTGVVYAPNGGIQASYSTMTARGSLVGQTVNLSGSNLLFEYLADLVPPRSPVIGVAE